MPFSNTHLIYKKKPVCYIQKEKKMDCKGRGELCGFPLHENLRIKSQPADIQYTTKLYQLEQILNKVIKYKTKEKIGWWGELGGSRSM